MRDNFNWVTTCRYLDICLVSPREFKCPHTEAKNLYFKLFNTFIVKISRLASEDVVLKLRQNAYLFCFMVFVPVLLTADKSSYDLILTRPLIKLFQTSVIDFINKCYMLCLILNVFQNRYLSARGDECSDLLCLTESAFSEF
jgi:hypothetical protein